MFWLSFFTISDNDFKDDNDINEIKEENKSNGNNEEKKDDEDIKENESRNKVFIFINNIINNSQKYFILSKDIIIDKFYIVF